MTIQAPPAEIIGVVDRFAPGALSAFVAKVNESFRQLHREVDLTGASLTSWYRSPSVNTRVGGHRDSQHLLGLGLDVAFARRSDNAAGVRAFRSRGLLAVDEGDHVHVQAWPAGVARRAGVLQAAYGPTGVLPIA